MASVEPTIVRQILNNLIDSGQKFVRLHSGEDEHWDYARDRITESNWARADEREQCAKLADQLGYFNVGSAIRKRGE